jgi:hypothetical protein
LKREYELVAVAELTDGTSQSSAPVTFSVVDYVPPSERLPEVP